MTDIPLTAWIVSRKTSNSIRTLRHVQFSTVVNQYQTTTLADDSHQFRCDSGSVTNNQKNIGRCREAIQVKENLK